MAESALQRAELAWRRTLASDLDRAHRIGLHEASAELEKDCAKARGCGVEVEALTFLVSVLRATGERAGVEQSTALLRIRNVAVIGRVLFPESRVLTLLEKHLATPPVALRLVGHNTVRDHWPA